VVTWICSVFPAVIFDIVQQASLRFDSFGLYNKPNNDGRALLFKTSYNYYFIVELGIILVFIFIFLFYFILFFNTDNTCVWTSFPVTILPIERRAGVWILLNSFLKKKIKNKYREYIEI